ncbi:D-sedoheptulose 7-phosphate isomerase [Thermoplasma volcanium]|nr:D-sedoheptulose 7-phosphate isomerase [Thermoplasma volcanium]
MDLSDYIEAGNKARRSIDLNHIEKIGRDIVNVFNSGGKLIVFGNGGSAADSQHFVAELSGHFSKERKALPAMALTVNTSALTAISNDYSYDVVFSRQLEAFAKPGDYVVGISTSGNSVNVVKGLERAKELGCKTLAMTGRSGGKIAKVAEEAIMIDSEVTSIIQEAHIAAIHMICSVIDSYY